MNCPNCGEAVEAGAAFCGNCGQALTAATSPIAQVMANQQSPAEALGVEPAVALTVGASAAIPAYAVPLVAEQNSQLKATLAIVLGMLGIVAALFLPLVGLALGMAGVVLATLSRRSSKHILSTVGLIISCLSVIFALATWAYVVNHEAAVKRKAAAIVDQTNSAPVQAAASLSTPCYNIAFASKLNVENVSGSCNMNAFNGASFNDSSEAYKVYATTSGVLAANFNNLAKQAIEKDIKQSLPTFTITKEVAGQFAGSPAYFVTTGNGQGVSLMEAVALHQTTQGDNFFVFVHAVGAKSVDLKTLEAGWQWQ